MLSCTFILAVSRYNNCTMGIFVIPPSFAIGTRVCWLSELDVDFWAAVRRRIEQGPCGTTALSQTRATVSTRKRKERMALERRTMRQSSRPLQDAANKPATLPFPTGNIVSKERLDGLLKHYHHKEA
jgi:hypothetical protein